MSQELEKVIALGVKRVHQETHISVKNLEAIFSGSFEDMTNVQFTGFISIIEREYRVDLSDVRAAFMEQWQEHEADVEPELPMTSPKSTEQLSRIIIIAVALVVVLIVILLSQMLDSKPAMEEPEPSVNVTEPLPMPVTVPTPTVETNVTLTEPEPPKEEEVAVQPLRIIPKAKLWLGMIDLETQRKDQKLTSDAFMLDTNRSWLLLFGHGYFRVEHGDERLEFSEENQMRFIYEDGVLQQLTRDEFKMRNRGQLW